MAGFANVASTVSRRAEGTLPYAHRPRPRVYVSLKPAVNAPQGQTVLGGLRSLGYEAVADVRIGKYLEIRLAGADPASAAIAGICHRLLANPVIEKYQCTIEPADPAGIPGHRPADRRPGWWAFSSSIASSSSAAGAC